MHTMFRKVAGGALVGISVVALTLPAVAPAFADAPGSGDPSIARISDVAGNVTVRRTDVDGTTVAVPNAPVTVGDYIETPNDGRSEIEFDHATVVRLAPATQVRFTHLTPDDHEVQLAQGTVEMRLFHDAGGRPVVETPSADVRPDEAGRYRITVDASGNTIVDVRSGHVDVSSQGGPAQTLGAGQAIEIAGFGAGARFRNTSLVAYDTFDGYCDNRDGGWSRVADYSYTDAGMVGEAELSDYGSWNQDAQYGHVWTPTDEPANWSPYSNGSWVWAASYGWTYVGNEPWGYAPYHYGRWFRGDRNRWSWQPGRADAGAYYAYRPAVVGFFGLGAGIGVSFAIGDVGWVALAPGENYYPWWGGAGYGYGGNSYAVYNTYNYYRNARYPGAAIAVTGRDFAAGRFTRERRLGRNDFAHAVGFRGVIPIVPTSRNIGFRGRIVLANRTPAFSGRFVKMGAPRITAVAFTRQRTTVATLARKQYPRTFATSVARQYTAPGRGAGFTRTTALVTRPHTTATVWNRFSPHTTAVKTYGRTTRAAYVAPNHGLVLPNHANAGRTYVAPAHHYTTPIHTNVTTHAYHAPVHTYTAPVHTYTAPVHAYHAPVHAYTASVHTYVAPVHTYRAPVHTYTAPVHTYTAPVHTYVAPPVHTYHPPVHTYVAPPAHVAPPVVHTVTHTTTVTPPSHPKGSDDHHR